MPIALALYLLVQRRRARYVVRFTNVDLLTNLVPKTPRWRRHVPTAFYLAAVAALAIALARPSAVLNVPREEATVMLAMDVSRSMIATDVSPTRLDAAKQAAETFIKQLPAAFRVGLVAFSTDARLVVAPTTGSCPGPAGAREPAGRRRDRARRRDRRVAPGHGRRAHGVDRDRHAGPSASPTRLPPRRRPGAAPARRHGVLSDGANSTGSTEPLDAASQAAAADMPVYTIALGTQDGTVDVQDPKTGQMRTLNVPPDTQTLAAIAETTGGRSFEAPTSQDLAQIYESLGSKVGYTQQEQEVTQWFAAAALLLVLGGAGLAALWFNRIP